MNSEDKAVTIIVVSAFVLLGSAIMGGCMADSYYTYHARIEVAATWAAAATTIAETIASIFK